MASAYQHVDAQSQQADGLDERKLSSQERAQVVADHAENRSALLCGSNTHRRSVSNEECNVGSRGQYQRLYQEQHSDHPINESSTNNFSPNSC